MTDYRGLHATELRRAHCAGERSVQDTAEAALAEIRCQNPTLNAMLEVDEESVRTRAKQLDGQRAAGDEPGELFGVPVAIKANMCARGLEAHCGSRMLAGYRPPYSATVVERLEKAGALIVGTTNMDEFAMGSSSENSAYGPTLNPWDTTRTPGGSSSGSAVAVAAGMVPLALGSDTGGSVRQPASMCGVVGFKPTYGRVSRYGLVAFGSSLDQVSPFGRSVEDVARLTQVISGQDPLDSTTVDRPATEVPTAAKLDGLRIGVPRELSGDGVDPGVRDCIEKSLADFEAHGAKRVELSLPHLRHAIATYYVIATAEASSNLARYDGVRYGQRAEGDGSLQGMFAASRAAGFGPEVRRRILLGTYVLSAGYADAWYRRALRVRRLIANDFESAFAECDVIASPTSPTPAFPLGEKVTDPVSMYLSDVMTVPISLAGIPAVSVPAGEVVTADKSLPVGLQLAGRALQDEDLLACALAFEARTDRGAMPPRIEEVIR